MCYILLYMWLILGMVYLLFFCRFIGPFVIMIGKILPVILKFLFLYVQIFLPFGFAFYLTFGGMMYLINYNYVLNIISFFVV